MNTLNKHLMDKLSKEKDERLLEEVLHFYEYLKEKKEEKEKDIYGDEEELYEAMCEQEEEKQPVAYNEILEWMGK